MKKHKKFCTRTDRTFLENFIIKPNWLSMAKREHILHFWKLCGEDFVTGVFHRMIGTVFKTDSRHVACWPKIFLYKQSWEVLFLLEEDYCPIPSIEFRDVYVDFHEWTQACIFQENDFIYPLLSFCAFSHLIVIFLIK